MINTTSAQKPTYVRFLIIALIFFVTAINYADRSAFSVASSAAGSSLNLSPVEIGYILSAFSWAYVLAQIPGGMLLDKFGAKPVYIVSIATWSLFTFLQGTVGLVFGGLVFVAFFSYRFLVGLCEAPSFPGNAKIVVAWFPISERGIATSIFNSAQYFSIVLFAPLMGWIAHNYGWRSVFFTMGALGFIAVLVFAKFIKNPNEHPSVNKEELEFITKNNPSTSLSAPASSAKNPLKWSDFKLLLNNKMLIGIYLTQYCINVLTYFFVTWFPIYLVKERGLDVMQAGFAASMPALFGFIGGVVGGLLTDKIMKEKQDLTLGRKIPIIIGLILASAILLCAFSNDTKTILIFMSIAFFGKGVASLGWALISDVAPKEKFATASSIFNTFGNIAGIITPIVIGYTIKITNNFNLGLIYVGAHCLIAILLVWFVIGKIKPIILEAKNEA